jgi:diguanylate cyclase (GGDEF)-like protein
MTQTSSPQRWKFVLVGALLAAGLSAGLLLIRAISDEEAFDLRWALDDLMNEGVTYAYVTCTTFFAGLVLGWLIGNKTDRLQTMSLTDSLTQLANRRGFLAVFNDELHRALRYRTSLAVMLVDVDNLKLINDHHGHGAGDLALRTVADSLRSSCRASDLAARYGGDEFALLVPSTSAVEAQELANRIRSTLLREVDAHPELDGVTVSVGISDLTCVNLPRVDALLASADAALYNAKAAGRDRISLAPSKKYATAHQAVCA